MKINIGIKKYVLLLAMIILCYSLYGCSKLDEDEFMKNYTNLVVKITEPMKIEKELSKNIKLLSRDNASDSVDGLLYVIHQLLPEMNTKLEAMKPGLKQYLGSDFEFNSSVDIERMTDTTIRGFATQVNERFMLLEEYDGEYYIKVNYERILNQYKDYINDDLISLIEFHKKENMNDFFNTNENMFNLDIVTDRIIKIEEYIATYPDSVYVASMLDSRTYYYQVYFGMNNDFLLDNNNKVLSSTIEHYKITKDKYHNSTLAKHLKEYLTKLEKTNYYVTDSITLFLTDLTSNPNTVQESSSLSVDDSVTENSVDLTVRDETTIISPREALMKLIDESQ